MGNIFTELRRRNVFRVAGVYAVVGWLLAQAAVILETSLGFPVWFDGVVVGFLLIGFPISMVLAWAFEMTPEGMKLTSAVSEDHSIAPKTGRKLDYAIVIGLVLVGVIVIADRFTPERVAVAAGHEASVDDTDNLENGAASIAVLPFADLSTDGDQEYFADGIAEEILNVLARIEALKVASRTSAFAFKSQSELSIPDIASALGVRHVLEGSVRTAGGTIRITAQLIDAETDQHIWSNTFDRELTAENIFAIQDEIAAAITDELASRIGVNIEAAPTATGGTSEVSAYETFLMGRDRFIDRNYLNLPLAVSAFEQAVAIDPNFARAWGWLAMSYAVSPAWGFVDRDYRTLAQEAADKALSLDAQNTSALTALGFKYQNPPAPDFITAVNYYERAIATDPQATTAHLWLSQSFRDLGFFERAETVVERCLELDPNYPVCLFTHAEIAVLQGRYEVAEQRLLKVFATGHAESYPQFLGVTAERGNDILLTLMLRELADLVGPGSRWMVPELRRALSDEVYDRGAVLERFETRIIAEQGHEVVDPYLVTAYRLAFRAYDRIPKENGAPSWWWYPGYHGLKNSQFARRGIEEANLPDYWRVHGFPPQCRALGADDFECD